MKKLMLVAVVSILIIGSAFKVIENNRGIGRVQKTTGKDVYIFSEPIQPYDVVFEIKATVVKLVGCPDIQEIVDAVVKKGLKDGKEFDGVVIGSGRRDIAIKYKD